MYVCMIVNFNCVIRNVFRCVYVLLELEICNVCILCCVIGGIINGMSCEWFIRLCIFFFK